MHMIALLPPLTHTTHTFKVSRLLVSIIVIGEQVSGRAIHDDLRFFQTSNSLEYVRFSVPPVANATQL